ncbi:MAG: hypothetical protein WD556_11730 [Actinomycetota bacterium]
MSILGALGGAALGNAVVTVGLDTKSQVEALDGNYNVHVTYSSSGKVPPGGRIDGATGYSGYVNRPTLFMAGEAGGREHVRISPDGVARGAEALVVHNHFAGATMLGRDVGEIVERSLSERLANRRR